MLVKNIITMILFEDHLNDQSENYWVDPNYRFCHCSYCEGDSKLHYGLNIPGDWTAWNSWWVIKYGQCKYIRWTFSFLKKKRKININNRNNDVG